MGDLAVLEPWFAHLSDGGKSLHFLIYSFNIRSKGLRFSGIVLGFRDSAGSNSRGGPAPRSLSFLRFHGSRTARELVVTAGKGNEGRDKGVLPEPLKCY